MATLTVSLPDEIEITPEEARLMLILRLFEEGRISRGKAAEIAGYSYRDFTKLLGERGISVFNYPPEEIEQDIQNAAVLRCQ